MNSVIAVSPFDCRMWALHDRMESLITEDSCRSEIESLRKHGQLIPALGRLLHGDLRHKVELIYGARRLFAARYLNIPLLVELREISDRDALVAMDIENRVRSDISPYERGLSYARWLREGHFSSQEDIGRALRISPSQVCRLIKLAQLPPSIVDAFDSPSSICENWGLEISKALEDPARRPSIIATARSIASSPARPSGRDVYRRLLTGRTRIGAIKPQGRDEVVKDKTGRPIFRIRQQSNSIAFVVPISGLMPACLDELRRAVSSILTRREGGGPGAKALAAQTPQIRTLHQRHSVGGNEDNDDRTIENAARLS